jgi:hypothetical protein
MASNTAVKKPNRSKLNLLLDIGLALLFVVDMEEHFTGLALHELIGVIITLAILIHLLLHWDWIMTISKTFFQKLIHESRLNYVLNTLLFVDMAVLIGTGILISRTLGLSLGLSRDLQMPLQTVHILAAHFSLVLVGLHVAMHWKWLATHLPKLFQLPQRTVQAERVAVRNRTTLTEA